MGLETAANERLPWLADEPAVQSPHPRRHSPVIACAAAAVAIVACGGFWMGMRSVEREDARLVPTSRPSVTFRLPQASRRVLPEVPIVASHDVRPAPAPLVQPAPQREVRIAPVPRRTAQFAEERRAAPTKQDGATAAIKRKRSEEAVANPVANQSTSSSLSAPAHPVPVRPFALPPPWNPRLLTGAAGRLVQVGAFGSVAQAKHGWWFMVHSYPAMAHLPAVVRPTTNSQGAVFYRFQVGTTSQAHSEVLCQRMVKIGLSCAVVGLPWKSRVER